MSWSCWRSGSSRASRTVRSTCWVAQRWRSTWSASGRSSASRKTSPTTSLRRSGTPAWRWVQVRRQHWGGVSNASRCDQTHHLHGLLQALCEDKSVEDVLQRHFNSSTDFRSMHTLLVRPAPPPPVWSLHLSLLPHPSFSRGHLQMFCLSRVSISKPTIRPADVLEASRMCFADAKASMLHGERRNPHQEMWIKPFCVGFYMMLFSLQDCPSWSSASSSPWSTWTTSMRESPSTSRWFTTVRHKCQRP